MGNRVRPDRRGAIPTHEPGGNDLAVQPRLGTQELYVEELAKRARLIADQLVRYPWRVWWFADSVGLEGLLAATEITGDERYRHFAYGLARGWVGRTLPRKDGSSPPWDRFDYTAPGTAMVDLGTHFADDVLLTQLQALAEWQTWRPRAHGLVLLDPHYALWAWVDCMQFQGPFLTRLAALQDREDWRSQGVELLLSHHEALSDGSRLYSHIFDVTLGKANGVHWGRGQGWAMRGLWQTWSHLPEGHSARETIKEILRSHLDSLVTYQLESGHWRTVVDDARAYEEASISAFYVSTAYPALRAGIVDPALHLPALERAWQAVEMSIDGTGWYRNVSADTAAGALDHYLRVPRDVLVPWGQGPALLAIKERLSSGSGA